MTENCFHLNLFIAEQIPRLMTLWMITKPLGKILVLMYPSIIPGEPLQYQMLPLTLWLLTAKKIK